MLLERMGKRGALTSHGFRSSFSDWATEVSPFSSELRESVLAHQSATRPKQRTGEAMRSKSVAR